MAMSENENGRDMSTEYAQVDAREKMEVGGRRANGPSRGQPLVRGVVMDERTRVVEFSAHGVRVTDSDVVSTLIGTFLNLKDAENAIQPLTPAYDGVAVYEYEVTFDRDDLGPVRVERDIALHHYTLGADGRRFVLDERVEL